MGEFLYCECEECKYNMYGSCEVAESVTIGADGRCAEYMPDIRTETFIDLEEYDD